MPNFDRREFLKRSGAVGATLAAMPMLNLGQTAAAAPVARKPNILVFLTDDHGQWAQGCYGNSELVTPNLDQLAARGTRMTQAFTPCPVCSPARASFFTGKMPSQHGVHDWIDETTKGKAHPGLTGQTLIGELLQDAGYYTGLVGKWHCGQERETRRGFDRWFSYWVNQYPHQGTQNFSDNGKHLVENGAQSPLLTNHAIDFLKDHKNGASGDKPFFLFVGYVDTHSPHKQAPADLVAQYQSATFKDIPQEKFSECHGKINAGKAASVAAERERLGEYYGAVSSIDREVGRIMDHLKSTGQLDNTVVVYTGDHGLNAGHHGIWEKGNGTFPQNFLDESIRVACTISWPAGGILQNAKSDSIVNHCDLFATLLDLASAAPATKNEPNVAVNLPGKSYLRQLRGLPAAGWSDAYFGEYGNARVIRTANHKLILRYDFAGRHHPNELYDLAEDPRETVNRYTDPKLTQVVQNLTDRLHAYFKKYSDPVRDGLKLADQPVCNTASPWMHG